MPAFRAPLVLHAAFHTTVADLPQLPPDSLAEVAFAGRSNAGKSSAINAITNQKRLAFVSKTPGRTQHLNFFKTMDGRYLVDLPGYGYAKTPMVEQKRWQALVGSYLSGRPQLAGLVLIMDIRHPFTELDLMLLDWFHASAKPVHILLSKADKLSRSQSLPILRAARATLAEHGYQGSVQLFSSPKHMGLDEVEGMIRQWLQMPPAKSGQAKKCPAQGEKAGHHMP